MKIEAPVPPSTEGGMSSTITQLLIIDLFLQFTKIHHGGFDVNVCSLTPAIGVTMVKAKQINFEIAASVLFSQNLIAKKLLSYNITLILGIIIHNNIITFPWNINTRNHHFNLRVE